MTHSEPKNFIYSKIGVKVYLKPEYHPSLRATDLSHPDILRKARELFDKRHGRVAGLPKICSENSEDAQTWSHFSPLLSMSPRAKGHWLKVFFEKALGRNLDDDLTRRLPGAELLFWRGKKENPPYIPPSNLGSREGNTEVDLTILVKRALIFIEAKYQSEIQKRTTHDPNRDQIIRNIDVGTYYAWKKGLDFYFMLLTSSDCVKSMRKIRHYRKNPLEIVEKLPHRTDISGKLDQLVENLGLITWDQLKKTRRTCMRS